MKNLSGKELIEIIQDSSASSSTTEHAYQLIYQKYSPYVWRYIWLNVKQRRLAIEDAEDVFADVWAAFFRVLPKFTWHEEYGEKALLSYLRRVVTSSILMFLRKASKYAEREVPIAMESLPDSSFPDKFEALATASLLDSLLMQLPAIDRKIIEMQYLEGWSTDEIAEKLGVTPNHVRVKTHRARESLRKALMEVEDS